MEKGVRKTWTAEDEARCESMVDKMHTFGGKNFAMFMRDLCKYDPRTKAGRRAKAQADLRIAIATDKDLESIASFFTGLHKGSRASPLQAITEDIESWKKRRAEIQARGIKRNDLEKDQLDNDSQRVPRV